MKKKVRLQDLADNIGISVSTVHRALTNPDKVSEQLCNRIHEVAEEMGYEVNLVASSLSSKKTLRFAVLCPDNIFYEQVAAGAVDAERELQVYGVSVTFLHNKESSYMEQLAQLNEITENTNYDGIVIAPAHTQLLNPAIQKLAAKGIPIITIINDLPDSARRFYVGQNPKVAGETAAYLYDTILSEGSTVAVMGSYMDHGLSERVKSFKEYLSGTNKNVAGDVIHYHETMEGAYEMCMQVLSIMKPDAVFCHSMIGTIGCARAIRDTGQKGNVFMVGFDLNEEILSFLNDGTLFATLYHAPFLQGSTAIKTLFGLVKGTLRDQKDSFFVNTNVIFKTNAETFTEKSL